MTEEAPIPNLKIGEQVHSINGVYEVDKKLGVGSFGAVYRVKDPNTGTLYAMKLESANDKHQVLKMEVCVLKAIEQNGGRHFCKIAARGKTNEYNFVVMTLVGPSLSELRHKYGHAAPHRRFHGATALRVALQTLEALEDMHTVGYIHRDVKPANYAIGRPEVNELDKIYILDFGLCRMYRKQQDGSIRLPRQVAKFRGTVRYAPLNCHNEQDLSRKDDLETWLYMVIEFTAGSLPWATMPSKQEVGNAKVKARSEEGRKEFLFNCPPEYSDMLDYIDKVQYWEEPDYKFMYKLLRRAMAKHRPPIQDNELYDWMAPTEETTPNKTHHQPSKHHHQQSHSHQPNQPDTTAGGHQHGVGHPPAAAKSFNEVKEYNLF